MYFSNRQLTVSWFLICRQCISQRKSTPTPCHISTYSSYMHMYSWTSWQHNFCQVFHFVNNFHLHFYCRQNSHKDELACSFFVLFWLFRFWCFSIHTDCVFSIFVDFIVCCYQIFSLWSFYCKINKQL